MRTSMQIQKPTQGTTPTSAMRSSRAFSRQSHEVNSLQRTIGNQAVQQLLQTNPEELEGGFASTASPLTHVVLQNSSRTGRPQSVQRIPGEGVDQYLSNYGSSYWGTGDVPPSETLPPSTEVGLRQARTEFDRANEGQGHFSRDELDRIHQGFEGIFHTGGERNRRLWIAILHYFTTTPLQRVAPNQVRFGGMQTSRDFSALVPSNIFTDPNVSNESIATMLMHEYAHIMQTRTAEERIRAGTCSEIPEEAGDPARPRMSTMCREPGEIAGLPIGNLEADNYAVEFFYLERAGAGGTRRLSRIFDIYFSPEGNGVASAGLVDSFQHRFQGTYGTLKCLYDIIDHETTPDYTSVYAPVIPALVNITSAEQASRLVQELVEQGVVYIRGILRTIYDGVLSNPGLFPINRPQSPSSAQ